MPEVGLLLIYVVYSYVQITCVELTKFGTQSSSLPLAWLFFSVDRHLNIVFAAEIPSL